MAAAARDRTNWSPGKSLIDFVASIGLNLDDLSSVDELQDRLDQISAAWNDLPIHERQRLDLQEGDLSGCERAMEAYQTDVDVSALIRSLDTSYLKVSCPRPRRLRRLSARPGC
jgi:hypothetical protein